ncbi:hypothetical protein PM082_014184 [Marasmius tenuissimus]|nr:hypothetical protein PM082_014184 [Marasmius tenuissimus]
MSSQISGEVVFSRELRSHGQRIEFYLLLKKFAQYYSPWLRLTEERSVALVALRRFNKPTTPEPSPTYSANPKSHPLTVLMALSPDVFNSPYYGRQSQAPGDGRSAKGHGTRHVPTALARTRGDICFRARRGRSWDGWELRI